MITELKQNIKKCSKCHTTLIFNDDDVKIINQGGWEEYIIKCPKCGNYIEVCYINGSWK